MHDILLPRVGETIVLESKNRYSLFYQLNLKTYHLFYTVGRCPFLNNKLHHTMNEYLSQPTLLLDEIIVTSVNFLYNSQSLRQLILL